MYVNLYRKIVNNWWDAMPVNGITSNYRRFSYPTQFVICTYLG